MSIVALQQVFIFLRHLGIHFDTVCCIVNWGIFMEIVRYKYASFVVGGL
jgi:hypothetical protein